MSLVRFDAKGEAVFIYEDGHPCLDLGIGQTKRASHVEPTDDGMWQADMGPMGGPVLEKTVERAEALLAEVMWLQKYMLDQ